MKKFESSVKQVPYSQEAVYRNISDLTNLERVRDRVPKEKLKEFKFDRDSVTVDVEPLGLVSLRIVERDEPKCVKYETTKSPMPFDLWIQVLPVGENASKMKVTAQADIPFVLVGMMSAPIQDALDKITDALALIPYE